MSVDPIVQALDVSYQVLAALDNYVKAQIEHTFLDRIPGVDPIARSIEHELAKAETTIKAAEKSIKDQIEPLLKAAVPDAISVVTSLARSLDDHLTKLLNNIATTEDVVSGAIATIRKHAPELSSWIYQEISGGLGQTLLNVLKTLEHQETSGVDALLDHLMETKNAPPFLIELVKGFRNRGAEWQALALPAVLVAALLGVISATLEPSRIWTLQSAFDAFPVKELDPTTIVAARIREVINDDTYFQKMRNNGYNVDVAHDMLRVGVQLLTPDVATRAYIRGDIQKPQWEAVLAHNGLDTESANAQWKSQLAILNEEDARVGFLRGILGPAEHDATLARIGYDSTAAAYRRQIYFYIPPVADLIHMGIRNVFNPEIVERFTLDGDYPEKFEEAAQQQGVSKEWSHKYWQSHWIMPGREAFFEMFQRTVDKPLDEHADEITLEDGTHVYNIMGRDTLNLALRDIDTPPFYRDKLTQIAFRPLTRIDIRRLHKVGLLTKAQVERAYLDLGNTPEHARLLAEFVVRLNATTTKNQAQSLIAGIQRHVVQLYVQDKLSADQVKSTLQDLEFTEPEIELFIQEANLVRSAEYSSAVEAGIGKLYMAGIITETDAIQRLRDADLPDDAIHTLTDKWNLAIEYRGGTEHILKHRELTKGEVLQALADTIIDQHTAESMLEALGYDQNSADAEISLTLYKAATATKRIQIDAIKASFINGVIEQPETSNRLDSLAIPFERRDSYLAEWTLARETRTERIPIATLRDMFKGEYLTSEELFAHLKRHRFTDGDAQLIIRFWSNQPAPKRLVGNA